MNCAARFLFTLSIGCISVLPSVVAHAQQGFRISNRAAVAQQQISKTPTVSSASGCNCGCGSSSGCTTHPKCELKITKSSSVGVTKCTKFQWTPPSDDCDCEEQKIDFYDSDIDADITIDLPKRIKKCVEVFKFERMHFDVCGCKIEVCVPCEICCTESTECVPTSTVVHAKFRRRTTPVAGQRVYDVWVENVKGLPNPAVLGLELTSDQARAKYGVTLP